jgi:hypothetical protein
MENQVTTNDRVLALLRSRLELGQKKYGQDIPIQGENGRNNLKESIEESLDLSVYLTATLLELDAQREETIKETGKKSNSLGIHPKHIRFILSGLHMLYDTQYRDNQLDICTEVDKLIHDIKATCKWDKEDENQLLSKKP